MSITDELDWSISKNNLEFFVKNQLKDEVADHHRDWIRRLTTKRRTATISSRDHGKTTIVSIDLPLWMISCTPQINPLDKIDNYNVIIVSNSLDQSEDIIDKTKIKIEETESLQSLSWYDTNKSEIRIREKGNHSKIESKAFGSSGLRGPHPRMCIVDDPLSETKYTLSYIESFYFNSISGMIGPTSYLHTVGTRFAYNDLYSVLAEPERLYDYKEYPALDEDNKPLWEQRYSYDDLMRKKAEVGNLSFAREYMCQPIDSSSSIFPMDLLEKAKAYDSIFEFSGDGYSRYLCAYDLARGVQAGADYFVGITGKKIRDKIKIVDITRRKGIGYKEQVNIMIENGKKYRPAFHYIENNNYQVVVESIAAENMLPVKGRTTGKQNRENAIFLIRSMLEHDQLEFPFGDMKSRELIDELILELSAFGYKNDKLIAVGRHDDLVLALSMLLEGFALFGKGGDYSGGFNEVDLPMEISGTMDIDMTMPWRSENLMNLGISN